MFREGTWSSDRVIMSRAGTHKGGEMDRGGVLCQGLCREDQDQDRALQAYVSSRNLIRSPGLWELLCDLLFVLGRVCVLLG